MLTLQGFIHRFIQSFIFHAFTPKARCFAMIATNDERREQGSVFISSPSYSERTPRLYPKQGNLFTSWRGEAGSYEHHQRSMQAQLYLRQGWLCE